MVCSERCAANRKAHLGDGERKTFPFSVAFDGELGVFVLGVFQIQRNSSPHVAHDVQTDCPILLASCRGERTRSTPLVRRLRIHGDRFLRPGEPGGSVFRIVHRRQRLHGGRLLHFRSCRGRAATLYRHQGAGQLRFGGLGVGNGRSHRQRLHRLGNRSRRGGRMLGRNCTSLRCSQGAFLRRCRVRPVTWPGRRTRRIGHRLRMSRGSWSGRGRGGHGHRLHGGRRDRRLAAGNQQPQPNGQTVRRKTHGVTLALGREGSVPERFFRPRKASGVEQSVSSQL